MHLGWTATQQSRSIELFIKFIGVHPWLILPFRLLGPLTATTSGPDSDTESPRDTCIAPICSAPSRSAMVRLSLTTRSKARALRPSWSMAPLRKLAHLFAQDAVFLHMTGAHVGVADHAGSRGTAAPESLSPESHGPG